MRKGVIGRDYAAMSSNSNVWNRAAEKWLISTGLFKFYKDLDKVNRAAKGMLPVIEFHDPEHVHHDEWVDQNPKHAAWVMANADKDHTGVLLRWIVKPLFTLFQYATLGLVFKNITDTPPPSAPGNKGTSGNRNEHDNQGRSPNNSTGIQRQDRTSSNAATSSQKQAKVPQTSVTTTTTTKTTPLNLSHLGNTGNQPTKKSGPHL